MYLISGRYHQYQSFWSCIASMKLILYETNEKNKFLPCIIYGINFVTKYVENDFDRCGRCRRVILGSTHFSHIISRSEIEKAMICAKNDIDNGKMCKRCKQRKVDAIEYKKFVEEILGIRNGRFVGRICQNYDNKQFKIDESHRSSNSCPM